MKCKVCNKNIPDISLYCNFCGAKQKQEENSVGIMEYMEMYLQWMIQEITRKKLRS